MTNAVDDQQFCLRWNNFQANITSQFETLRDEEDFTDVTIACEGQRIQAHKVVLSACSPFFKELFKTNPCSHPIIFMRDVESQHITALIEFMYTGEVNVAQAQLTTFLKTAESLKIRGLTDTSADHQKDDNQLILSPERKVQLSLTPHATANERLTKSQVAPSCNSTVTSSQDVTCSPSPSTPPPPKRQCTDNGNCSQMETTNDDLLAINSFILPAETKSDFIEEEEDGFQPKLELPEYLSDEDGPANLAELTGGMEMIPHFSNANYKESNNAESHQGRTQRRRILDEYFPFPAIAEEPSNSNEIDLKSRLKNFRDRFRSLSSERENRLVKLGEGIEIQEDQLKSVKWNDYRKLTRGLAAILFSPAELATCSVTGQRWSRAGSVERPVKPALDRAKVQAIISYVATRFPMVEISRIKQVLAYKCKENSTAFKMKAVRYYGDGVTSQN